MQRTLLCLLAVGLALPIGSYAASADQGPPVLPGEVANEVVVSFAGAVPANVESWLGAHGGQLLLRDDTLHWVSARFADAGSAGRFLDAAQASAGVRAASRDGIASVLALPSIPGQGLTPNDPLYAQQWGYPAIGAPLAWGTTLGAHSVHVIVLDTGIYLAHPDLQGNLCGPFASFVPSEPTVNDGFGHGTHVSGTIAAVTNNGLGVAGTSQSCLGMGKVLGAGGSGQWTWVAAGIVWAADNGADIISMSLGGSGAPQVVADAVAYAYAHDVLVVSAAGNSGCRPIPGAGTVGQPALYPGSMAVAAVNQPDGLVPAQFSSCGFKVEIAAPGVGVLSTFPPCNGPPLCSNSGYGSIDGTSMATPHVAGSAALVKAQDPALTNVELRCILDVTATDAPAPGRDFSTGWGVVDPYAALAFDAQLTATGTHDAFTQACAAGAPALFYAPPGLGG
ncbi:MAG: S8 family serine peptidase [Halobacteriales archaeon]|nr:S8 family serine peptidase [Halobacteriales archaeon]